MATTRSPATSRSRASPSRSSFDLEFDGVGDRPVGRHQAGFTAETEISRKDFGIEWNIVLETGGVLVGDKVKIQLEIEAVKA